MKKPKLRAPVHKPTEAITPKDVYQRSQNEAELKEAMEEYYKKKEQEDGEEEEEKNSD